MASAFDAIAAVATLLSKSGLADELNYQLTERRKKGQRLSQTVNSLPDPKPPRKGN